MRWITFIKLTLQFIKLRLPKANVHINHMLRGGSTESGPFARNKMRIFYDVRIFRLKRSGKDARSCEQNREKT